MEEYKLDININNVIENYGERIQRLALFDPLYKLQNKNSKDNSNNIIDYFSLGLLSLLFFFENMLIRNKKSVQYSILKAEKADLETNTQYYTLDEQGLELIFATKEYFNEFQLSINQLVLRKQLEKGEFVGALRQIDEMGLDVKNLQDRMMRIKHEVNRNIVSTETYERYKGIIEDINMRLQRENEEFDELQSFVKETREKVGNEITNDKDRKAYELIIEIDKDLEQVHYEHRLLLKESIILKTSALQAAQESLYYVGIDSFNFDQEITSRLFSSPLPLNSSRTLIEPFMYLEKYEIWSPLTVFSKQRIENKDKQTKTQDFLAFAEEEEMKLDIKIQRENFKKIAEILLEAMGDNVNEITLNEVVKYMKENGYAHILDYRIFYDFWIILHQKSPIVIDTQQKTEEFLFGEAFNLLINKGNTIYIEETQGILKVTDRFTIRNMKFRLEDKYASV